MSYVLTITVTAIISDDEAEVFLEDTSDIWADSCVDTLGSQAEFVKDTLREPTWLGTEWKVKRNKTKTFNQTNFAGRQIR